MLCQFDCLSFYYVGRIFDIFIPSLCLRSLLFGRFSYTEKSSLRENSKSCILSLLLLVHPYLDYENLNKRLVHVVNVKQDKLAVENCPLIGFRFIHIYGAVDIWFCLTFSFVVYLNHISFLDTVSVSAASIC